MAASINLGRGASLPVEASVLQGRGIGFVWVATLAVTIRSLVGRLGRLALGTLVCLISGSERRTRFIKRGKDLTYDRVGLTFSDISGGGSPVIGPAGSKTTC